MTRAPYFTSLVAAGLLLALLLAGGIAYPGFLSLQVMLNLLIDNAQIMRFHTKSHLSQHYGMLPQRMTACNCNEQPSAEDRQQK